MYILRNRGGVVKLMEEIIMHQSYFVDIVYFLIRFFVGPIVRLIWVKKVTGFRNIPLNSLGIN